MCSQTKNKSRIFLQGDTVGVCSDFIKEVVIRPDFFVCGDYYDLTDIDKAEDYWRCFWQELAEDLGQDIYVCWVTDRQASGGPHHHAVVSFEYPEKIRCVPRVFGKLANTKNGRKELHSVVGKRWEYGWDRRKGYGTRKRGTMSFMRYEPELDGVLYLANHMKVWVGGDEGAGHSPVRGGFIQDKVFCGKSKRCRKHYRKRHRCRNDYDGVFWKRVKIDRD